MTLTLPADSLRELRQIATARSVSLSTVAADLLRGALVEMRAGVRSAEVLESYRKPFADARNKRTVHKV